MDYSGGGGVGKGYVSPPLKLLGMGVGLASPLPTPMQINALVRLNCIQLLLAVTDNFI